MPIANRIVAPKCHRSSGMRSLNHSKPAANSTPQSGIDSVQYLGPKLYPAHQIEYAVNIRPNGISETIAQAVAVCHWRLRRDHGRQVRASATHGQKTKSPRLG